MREITITIISFFRWEPNHWETETTDAKAHRMSIHPEKEKNLNQIWPRPAQLLALPCSSQQKILAGDRGEKKLSGWALEVQQKQNFRKNLPPARLVEQTPEGTISLRAFSLNLVKPHKTPPVQPFARGGRWAPSVHGLSRYFPHLSMTVWCFCSANASPSAKSSKPMLQPLAFSELPQGFLCFFFMPLCKKLVSWVLARSQSPWTFSGKT